MLRQSHKFRRFLDVRLDRRDAAMIFVQQGFQERGEYRALASWTRRWRTGTWAVFQALVFSAAVLFGGDIAAQAACALPHNLANGQPADATKVMDNYNALVDCIDDVQAPYREFGPFAPPTAASFTTIDAPSSITPSVTDVAGVGLVYSVPVTSNTTSFPGAYRHVPVLTSWTLTLRAKYPTLMGSFPEFGVWLKDSSGKMLGIVMESRTSAASLLVKRCNSNTSLNNNVYNNPISDAPGWFRVNYDGTNINLYVSWDSQNWLFVWSETKTTFLNGTLELVGIGGLTGISTAAMWKAGSQLGGVVTYWDIDDDPASGRTVP